MSISLLYGCFQVELSVRDLDAARAFLGGVLGAEPIEQQLAREIGELFPHGGYRVDHLDCGQATFQLNEPSLSPAYRANKSVHRGYLERVGPCVANLNFYVDDIVHARELLGGLGAPTLSEGPSSVVRSLADYGPDNTRPGGDIRPFLFMGSRHLIGLDLEIMEPNFVRFVDQSAQYPCFFRPQANAAHPDLRLTRLRIAVNDLATTYDNLVGLFTPGSRSQPYAVRQGSTGSAFRITVGGMELEYCEPRTTAGPLAEFLEHYGPGVITLEFAARSVDPFLARARAASSSVTQEVDLLGEQRMPRRWQIAGREVVGFDIVLDHFNERTWPGNQRPA